MNSREVEEKKLWKAYLAEKSADGSRLSAPDADEIAAYLDRESEGEAAERMEYYLAGSAAGLRIMRDMRAILDATDDEPSIMPAHIMGRAHAAVRAAIAAPEEFPSKIAAGSAENAVVPAESLLKRIFGVQASGNALERRGVWSGIIWAAAILLMSFVGYFGFTIGEETGDEGRMARTQKEISRPDLLFSVDEGRRAPDLMPVGYELGVAE